MLRRRDAPRVGAALVASAALAGTVSIASVDGWAQASGPRGSAGASANNSVNQAIAAFEAHDYERALRLFQDAYVERHDPALLFNVAATLERLNRLNEAADALQTYLSRADNAEGRRIAQERLDALRARIAASASPPPIEASASSPPVSSAPPVVETQPSGGSIVPGVVVGSIGIAAVAAGAVVFAIARDPGLDRFPNEQAYRDAARASDVQRVVGAVVGGVGVAAIATGVVLLVMSRGHANPRRAQIYFTPSDGGASIGVVHAF